MERWFLLISLSISATIKADLPPVEHFAKELEYHDAEISPNGDYIAVQRSADEGKQLVAVISTKDLKLMSHIPATGRRSPFNPVWISNDRLVVEFTEDALFEETEYTNGELLAFDANGKRKKRIIEHQAGITTGKDTRLNHLHGIAEVVHALPDERNQILIAFWEFGFTRIGVRPKIYRLNALNGKVKFVTEAPAYSNYASSFTFSSSGEPLYHIGIDRKTIKTSNSLVTHKYVNKKWQKLDNIDIDSNILRVVAESKKPNEVYILAEYFDSTDKIYRYNLETQEKKLVFYHPDVDPTGYDIDSVTNTLTAVFYDAGYPDIHIIDQEHAHATWYPALFQYFEGLNVVIISATNDKSKLLLRVDSATEPGQFHIFDTQTKKMRYLFNAASWIKPEELSPVEPIAFEARDGLKVHGYLTLPKNTDAEKKPLVVLPHGGPRDRDYWLYDREVQFLASRGYAVLQINFRGSSGYGREFLHAGDRKWGSDIQYDIIDGTKYVAGRDDIDENKICIMGGSFGGYSALMSPTIEPDLYKCAIGMVGVYDLNLMWTSADIEKLRTGENYLNTVIGKDEEQLNAFSPVYNVDKLKAPVFLAHGKKDWRVDVKHFDVMKKALDEKQHPLETMLVEKEGHGFANEENRIEYLKRVENFLAKHIGGQ